MKVSLSIVLPCYNESQNIPVIVERLKPFYPQVEFELILVDNGSTDHTPDVIARLMGQEAGFVRSVRIEKNIGYGHGIFMGLKAARGDVLVFSHADIQTPPEDCLKAFKIFNESGLGGQKVLVKGMRINRRGDEAFFTKWLSRVANFVLGYRFEDINGQPKLFGRKLFESFKNPPLDFTFDLYVMNMARLQGYILKTFPVDFGQRIHGHSSWAGSFLKKHKTISMYIVNIIRMRFAPG